MWVRKSPEEKNQTSKTYTVKGLLIAATVVSVFGVIFYKLGISGRNAAFLSPQKSWAEAIALFPMFFGGSCIVFVLVYLLSRIASVISPQKTNAVLCLKCNKVKAYDGTNLCECGGELRDFSEFKWIEENSGK